MDDQALTTRSDAVPEKSRATAPTAKAAPRAAAVATSRTPGEEQISDAERLRREEKAAGLVMHARNLLRKGQREQVKSQLQQAFVLNPTDCGALELLGDIYLEQGEQQKAIAVFERGRQHHPRHAAFEEKIALAHVDLAEMERDRALKEQLLSDPVANAKEQAGERKPTSVALLSLLLPGAGQYYNEEPERAFVFFPVALLLFFAWAVPWLRGWSMGGFERVWIALALTAAAVWHIVAAADAARSARAEIEEQKRLLGMG